MTRDTYTAEAIAVGTAMCSGRISALRQPGQRVGDAEAAQLAPFRAGAADACDDVRISREPLPEHVGRRARDLRERMIGEGRDPFDILGPAAVRRQVEAIQWSGVHLSENRPAHGIRFRAKRDVRKPHIRARRSGGPSTRDRANR
jgi:hypothetical protein